MWGKISEWRGHSKKIITEMSFRQNQVFLCFAISVSALMAYWFSKWLLYNTIIIHFILSRVVSRLSRVSVFCHNRLDIPIQFYDNFDQEINNHYPFHFRFVRIHPVRTCYCTNGLWLRALSWTENSSYRARVERYGTSTVEGRLSIDRGVR